MPQILAGSRVRDEILAELRPRIDRVTEVLGRPPGLSVILAGHNPASEVYVGSKTKTAAQLGIAGGTIRPDAAASTEDLLKTVAELNARPDVDGILVQLPLPPQIDAQRVLMAVSPAKDVDGFHPCNVGALSTGRPGPRPCTPAGIIQLLKRYGIPIAGKRAVVVGRSDIVGKPMAMLLLQENATVTVCHSRTPDLASVCREGEILVAAIGRPALLTGPFIRPGAVVIDVGMNTLTDRTEVERIYPHEPARLERFDAKGSVLVGDVHPVSMFEYAHAYTPVPGGVGPLTIAMLMVNTVESAERSAGL